VQVSLGSVHSKLFARTIISCKKSLLSPPSPPDRKLAQNQGKSGEGIISTEKKVPPQKDPQDEAQIDKGGDSGYLGGITR
jgi:hypothetical protein